MSQVDQEPKGPFITAAFLCEQLLTDDSGVISAIRIIDRVTQTVTGPEVPDDMPPMRMVVKGLIMLKDGEARGRHVIKFRIEEPSGLRREVGQRSVTFSGGGHGTNIKLDLNLELKSEGLYWIDVLLGSQLLTRMPLEVVYDPTPTGAPSAPG